MLKPNIKRFYKSVDVHDDVNGFAIRLDTRPIKTPAGKPLCAPTHTLAEAIAAEWQGQGDMILPDTMPLTKSLNTALDRIAPNRDAIIADLANYAASDVLCYRAESPIELVRRQSTAWDPWLDWAAERHGARLIATIGITHVAQPPEALARLREAIAAHDDHRLVAVHTGVTITASIVLGLAFAAKAITAEEAFAIAQIEETYQAELWGLDAEAEKARANRLADLKAAEAYLNLLAGA
ncbi:MAG: ATP12 family protein [Alphaproteobacteria bacterium]|nr:ATP12 family protein [Alphaproteobacteria bacterium]